MMIMLDDDGDESVAYTDEERAAIVACFPSDVTLTESDAGLWRKDFQVLRSLTWAAGNYVTAWHIAPKRYDIDNIADARKERLEQIDGTIAVASKTGDQQLVERLKCLRASVERETWWETLRDPRGSKHRNEFLAKVFLAWAELAGVPLDQCKISTNETSPMLRFVRAATDPVFEITGEGIDADMIKRLLMKEKNLLKNGE